MPELPEVHTTATMLQTLISGRKICDVWTDYGSTYHAGKQNIKDPKYFAHFKKEIVGRSIASVSRRGKNVLIHLSGGATLLVHMKMTGHLLYGTYTYTKGIWNATTAGVLQDMRNQFIHLVFTLSGGKHLVLSDLRKFAKVTLIKTSELATSKHLELGPEPLEENFTVEKLRTALMRRPRAPIKLALMDPTLVAGIGNIYSDEILFASNIHPQSRVEKIPLDLWPKIHKTLKEILRKGIDFGGDSTSDYRNPLGEHGKFHYHHKAYRNTGKACSQKRCCGIIERLAMGGRGAHFCKTHQHLYT